MARQPARVRAIVTGMANQVYRVRVELIEIREFLERYRCMAKVFDVKELQIRWQVHLYGEAASFFFVFLKDQMQELWNRTRQVHLNGGAASGYSV